MADVLLSRAVQWCSSSHQPWRPACPGSASCDRAAVSAADRIGATRLGILPVWQYARQARRAATECRSEENSARSQREHGTGACRQTLASILLTRQPSPASCVLAKGKRRLDTTVRL